MNVEGESPEEKKENQEINGGSQNPMEASMELSQRKNSNFKNTRQLYKSLEHTNI